MIATIIIIGIALVWLGMETHWLTIRLPYGQAVQSNSRGLEAESNTNVSPAIDTPYYWQPDKTNMILCQHCSIKCHKDKERWTGWKIPTRTIKAWGSTMIFNEGCNIARAGMLKDVAQSLRPRKVSVKPMQPPLFITQVRIGSHNEWVETTPKHGYHHIVEEFTTHYNDCLPGKGWVKTHEHDEYPEPTIELSVDGELKASINGNYKRGLIADTLKPYTTKARVGRKTATLNIGEADRVKSN